MGTPFKPLPLDAFPESQRHHINRLNRTLYDLDRLTTQLEMATASLIADGPDGAGVRGAIAEGVNPNPRRTRTNVNRIHVTRVTPDATTVFNGSSTATGVPALTLGLTNTVGTTTYAVAVDAGIRFPLGTNSLWGRSNADVTGLSFATMAAIMGISLNGASDTQVLFNDGGSIGSEANLVWSKAANVLGVTGGIRGVSHAMIGAGGANIGYTNISPLATLLVTEDLSNSPGTQTALLGGLGADGDAAAGAVTGCQFQVALGASFDPDRTGGGACIIVGNLIDIGGTATAGVTGTYGNIKGLDVTIAPTLGATDTVSTVAGVNVAAVNVSGPTPLLAYGVRVEQVSAASGESAAFAGLGSVKIATTNKLQWGRNIGAASTNSMRARTSLGSNIVMELASADTYEWSTAAFFPIAGGTRTCGQNGNGWSAFVFKDYSANFELFVGASSVPALSADRRLLIGVSNADRELTLMGNPTLADWFDQSVKTTAAPTFAGASFSAAIMPTSNGGAALGKDGLGWSQAVFKDTSAAFEVTQKFTSSPALGADRSLTIGLSNADRTLTLMGDPTLGDWFDQSVKIAAAPTFGNVNASYFAATGAIDHLRMTSSGGGAVNFSAGSETLSRRITFTHGGANRTVALTGNIAMPQAAYTISGTSLTRTWDATTIAAADVPHALATLIADLQAAGVIA